MRLSCSRIAFWSDSLQRLSVTVMLQLQERCRGACGVGWQSHTVTYCSQRGTACHLGDGDARAKQGGYNDHHSYLAYPQAEFRGKFLGWAARAQTLTNSD